MADFTLTDEHFNIPGRGLVVVAKLNSRTKGSELSKLIGQNVEFDGVLYKIRGVEAFAIMEHRVGETIGLLIEPLEKPFV